MSKYKLGDLVRTANFEDETYEASYERVFLFEKDGWFHCVNSKDTKKFNAGRGYAVYQWPYIIEKPPAEYTLKGKDIELMSRFIDKLPLGVSPKDYKRVLEIQNELNEATK